MDHLPVPSNPRLTPFVIKYECLEFYDGGSAIGYPKRNGWEVLYSPYGIRYLHNGQEPEIAELRSFLQNWLYFGLLHEAFGKDMNIQDFISENEDGTKVITTAPLNDAVSKMSKNLEPYKEASKEVQESSTAELWAMLEHTWRVSLNSIKIFKNDIIGERFWVSVAILAESIETVLYGVFLDGGTNMYRQAGNPPVGIFMVEEMRTNGWCPFDVKRIDCTTRMVSMLYYLSNLSPPRAHLSHKNCTEDLCEWMSIGKDYETRHIESDCACEGFQDVGKVIEVLHGKGVPLIQGQRRDPHDPMTFSIIDSETGVDFVAISHVWAEGLGNPYSNSLPSCSLEWVQSLVNQLPGSSTTKSTPFWCDTLCVPISPMEMQTVAMNRLRHPYQQSSRVLVLDSYLYTKDSSRMSSLEIWSCVIVCSWSRRLWTFQESRLAKDVWFQFADRALQLGEVLFNGHTDMAQEVLAQAVLLAYRGHIVIRTGDPDFTHVPTIRIMREALRGRAVTVASDEALCVFCNMFLDMELVTILPPEERMPMFWRTVQEVPIGIIFSTTKRKLTQPGLHWAPQSFMGELETPHWLIEKWPPVNGYYTPRGLRMPVGGFMMSEQLLLWDDSFDTIFTDTQCQLRDEKGSWYWLELSQPWNQSRTDFPVAREQLCLLMNQTIQERVAGDDPFAFASGVQGIIGTVEFDSPGTPPRFTGYRHILLHRYAPALQELHRSVYNFVEQYVETICARQDRLRLAAQEQENKDEDDVDEADEDVSEEIAEDTINIEEVQLKPPNIEQDAATPLTSNVPDTNEEAEIIQNDVAQLDISQGHELNSEDDAKDNDEHDSGDDETNQRSSEERQREEQYETPDTFELTDARRVEVQKWAEGFARAHEPTRKLAIAHGRVQNRDEDAAIEQYGFHCRFQLQMRKRNRMWSFPKNAIWYID